MTDETNKETSLADQNWFVEFLASKGFSRSLPDTFTNGKATVTIEGHNLSAHPNCGDKIWNAGLHGGNPETIKLIVSQILKMRPFLTEADFAAERAEKERVDVALMGIATTIKEGPDTHGGVQLRRFLWSLYNAEHLVNLYRMTAVLDGERSAWVAEVVTSALVEGLNEADIKRALVAAGEMKRWDQVEPSDEDMRRLEEAEVLINTVLKSIPPSYSHVEVKRAREALSEAKDAILCARQPQANER